MGPQWWNQVDTQRLGRCAFGRAGSNPAFGTVTTDELGRGDLTRSADDEPGRHDDALSW